MAAELSMDLQRLTTLQSALDIIRFLGTQPEYKADMDTICDGLGISETRFQRAIRRLVNLKYVQLVTQPIYSLTPQGERAVEELRAYDAAVRDNPIPEPPKRRAFVVLPRVVVAGKSMPLRVGFAPDGAATNKTDIIVRLDALYATLSADGDHMLRLGHESHVIDLELTPDWYDQIRVRLEVYQLSDDGEDVFECGGMYVDVDVVNEGEPGEMIAYGTDLAFV